MTCSNVMTLKVFLALGSLTFALPCRGATFSAGEVAKHRTEADCWLIIKGKVYDVTSYIDDHPASKKVLVESCGTDATKGWNTKGSIGKPHSKKAEALLKTMLKGELGSSSRGDRDGSGR